MQSIDDRDEPPINIPQLGGATREPETEAPRAPVPPAAAPTLRAIDGEPPRRAVMRAPQKPAAAATPPKAEPDLADELNKKPGLLARLPRLAAPKVGVKKLGAAGALVAAGFAGWMIFGGDVGESISDGAATVATVAATNSPLRLRELKIDGRREVATSAVIAALDLYAGSTALGVNASKAREALRANPWIRDADVAIESPTTVRVKLTERIPSAVWQNEGAFWIIDELGDKVAQIASPKERLDLPYIVGPGAPAAVAEARQIILGAPKEVAAKIGALTRVSGRRWDAEMIGGMRVMLPEVDPIEAMRKLATIEKDFKIFRRDLKMLDLRIAAESPVVRLGVPASLAQTGAAGG